MGFENESAFETEFDVAQPEHRFKGGLSGGERARQAPPITPYSTRTRPWPPR